MPYQLGTITVGDFYARVDNGARNVENFEMEIPEMIAIIKATILRDYSLAQTALREFYLTIKRVSVSTSSQDSVFRAINMAGTNAMDVLNIMASATQPYLPAKNMNEFIRVQSSVAHEHRMSRYYLPSKGGGEILVANGSLINPPDTSVLLHYVRYPDLSNISPATVVAQTDLMDLPDWFNAFEVLSCTIQAIKEKGLTPPQALMQQVDATLTALADRMAADEARALATAQDTVTK